MGINLLQQILKHNLKIKLKLKINSMYKYFKFDFCEQIVIKLGSYLSITNLHRNIALIKYKAQFC